MPRATFVNCALDAAFVRSLANVSSLARLELDNTELSELPLELPGRLSYLTELVIVKNAITYVPDSLCSCSSLESINLASNLLRSLPDGVGRLAMLRRLLVMNNTLVSLPSSLSQLHQLVEVDARINCITAVPPAAQLAALRVLRLDSNRVKAFPERLSESVRHLSLEDNAVTSLPTERVCYPVNAVTLNLRKNLLTSVPSAVGTITRLAHLVLGGNELTSIPDAVCELTGLETLRLNQNAVCELPQGVTRLTRLALLNVDANAISVVPSKFRELTALRMMNITRALSSKALEDVCALASMESLWLTGNDLAQCPPFGKLERLTDLRVSDNRLVELDASCSHWTNLEYVDMSNNLLAHLPDDFCARCTQLAHVKLFGNALYQLPAPLAAMPSLRYLDVDRNNIGDVKLLTEVGACTGLEYLSIADNRITCLSFSEAIVTSLTYLSFANNRLGSFPSFAAVPARLSEFNASGIEIAAWPVEVGRFSSLEVLRLCSNALQSVGDGLASLCSLRKLYLSGNALTCVPPAVQRLPSLKLVNMRDNMVEHASAADIPSTLEHCILLGNPVADIGGSHLPGTFQTHGFDMSEQLQVATYTTPARERVQLEHFARLAQAHCSEVPLVLCFGCSRGYECKQLQEVLPGGRIVGVDISDEALAFAREHNPHPCIEYYHSIKDQAGVDARAPFDGIVARHVLINAEKHVLVGMVQSLCSVLKPGGVMLLTEMDIRISDAPCLQVCEVMHSTQDYMILRLPTG